MRRRPVAMRTASGRRRTVPASARDRQSTSALPVHFARNSPASWLSAPIGSAAAAMQFSAAGESRKRIPVPARPAWPPPQSAPSAGRPPAPGRTRSTVARTDNARQGQRNGVCGLPPWCPPACRVDGWPGDEPTHHEDVEGDQILRRGRVADQSESNGVTAPSATGSVHSPSASGKCTRVHAADRPARQTRQHQSDRKPTHGAVQGDGLTGLQRKLARRIDQLQRRQRQTFDGVPARSAIQRSSPCAAAWERSSSACADRSRRRSIATSSAPFDGTARNATASLGEKGKRNPAGLDPLHVAPQGAGPVADRREQEDVQQPERTSQPAFCPANGKASLAPYCLASPSRPRPRATAGSAPPRRRQARLRPG